MWLKICQVRYLPLNINIPQENNKSYRKNNFLTGHIENPIGYCKNTTGIIYPVGEKYFLQHFDSDR